MEQTAEVWKHIRSCVISSKEKLSLKQLNHDYKLLLGEWIPYQRLGFRKLEDLIQSADDLNLLRLGSEYYVTAKQSAKSSHMTEMIAKQKSTKKRLPQGRFYRGNPPPRLQQTSGWRPKSSNFQPNRYQSSHRPQALSHSQFVNRSPATHSVPSVASKVVIPEHSTINKRPQPSLPAPASAVRRPDMNHRLNTARLQEQIRAMTLTNNTVHNGNAYTASHNGIATLSNRKAGNNIQQRKQRSAQAERISADELNSTKKRISTLMSGISTDRDSGNSSPTNEVLPPSPSRKQADFVSGNSSPTNGVLPPSPPSRHPDFVRTQDPLADLKTFAQIHKLGEVIVGIAQVKSNKNKFFSCKIKIGHKHMYKTYPKEFTNAEEAEKFCCEEALADLIPKCKRKSLMISSERDMLCRIPPMLEKHNHGIWAWQLNLDYSEKYNELLPDDWLKIVDSSPCVQIEKISEDHILYHCQPGDVLQKGQQRFAGGIVSLGTNVSIPANTVQFGEDGKLLSQITCVVSANEIWCEQIGTKETEDFADMFDRLQIYYQEHERQLKPERIFPAIYYIAKYEGFYYRVRAVKVNNDDVDCFFIDCGDEVAVPKTDMFDLKREYATVQAQAFVCRLSGLEDLYEVSANSQSLASLCDTQVVLELAIDIASNASVNEVLPVFMYDSETGHSINERLIPTLTMELATPCLQPDGITEVYVSNIESNGDVYVQVRTQGYDNLQQLKAQIEEQVVAKPPNDILYQVTKSNSREKLYFLHHKATGKWCRTKLIDWAPTGGLVQVHFVDEGHTDVITVAQETLYPLEALNDVFNNYPYQALKVKMALDTIPSNFVALARKAMPKEQPVLLKIMGSTEDNVSLVKLFKRNSDGGLFCINESVALETELNTKKEDLKNKFKLSQFGGSGQVPSTGKLKCPPLPKIGEEYFEVYVPVAVSPYNFFVQPFDSKSQLNEMMEKLQERYQYVQHGNLKVEDILPGSIYASKHDDGFWYRTSVIKVINSGSSVSVFYCDFGYYQTLPVKQLLLLDEEFMQLPYQALKAKLAGIKPKQSKWTMEDCEQFKELIERKHLFGQLISTEKDVLYESDLMLKLALIDTSSEDDVIIGKELVKRGVAVEA